MAIDMEVWTMKVAVVGLGYVGLPLAVEFGKKYPTIGFDLSAAKVSAICRFEDATANSPSAIEASGKFRATTDAAALAMPISSSSPFQRRSTTHTTPDFSPLIGASVSVGRNLKRGATVVFESTVYPGATEEVCIPSSRSTRA
jgi:UDP-N-acetyl-D-galactosamine dehydrogenase